MRAPPQSQCAVHPFDEAPFVCGRCGNFMCVACAAGDVNCPTCRALTPATGFPFNESATLEHLLTHSLNALKREWQSCAIAAVLYVAIVGVGSMLVSTASSMGMMLLMRISAGETWSPLLYQASSILQQFALIPLQCLGSLGLMRMLLDVVMGRSPTAGRFFSEMRFMPRALAIQLPVTVVLVVPGTVAAALQAAVPGAGSLVATGVSCVFLPLFLFFGLSVWLFSIPELLISDCTAIEAMQRAFSLGAPWRNVRVLGYGALAGALMLAGAIACGVGVLAGLPFGTLLMLSLFLALRASSGLPVAKSL